MNRLPWGRILFVLVIIAVSLVILLFKPIVFGLDLQGGSHLLIRIHADEAVESEVDDTFAAVRNALNEANLAFENPKESIVFNQDILHGSPSFKQLADIENERPYVEFTLTDASKMNDALEAIRKRVNTGAQGYWDMTTLGRSIRLTIRADSIVNIRRTTVENVRRSISYRIDQLGVAEPNIVIHGDPNTSQRILIQLPGIEDTEEAKRRIRTPGKLEFRMVVYDNAGSPYQAPTREDLLKRLGGTVPAGTELVPEYQQTEAEAGGRTRVPVAWYLLYKEAQVNSSHLVSAERGRDETNNYTIHFSLNADGGERIRLLSRANINKLLATVLDGEAIVVARIESELGSESRITGHFSAEDADRLAWLLRTGAVPTSMHFEEERSVGPALGADSIRLSVNASIWGMALVALFMLLYYRFSGLIAVTALALNIVMIMSFLAWFGAVLTVPGIAGIILTIGMAVDANVLIFERIKEELRLGRTISSSIDSGFRTAFGTIFDSNVTTLIAAVFLFQFGTGPIRGFATTITIGILASMFTAVFVARVIFDSVLLFKRRQMNKLSI
jgi:preprotein translocase subunit SecD